MNAISAAPHCMPDLESVISTAELNRRPSHPPNHAEENRALIALARELATSPGSMLQKLAETALILCRAHSAGISLLEEGRKRFQWKAIAGQWASHLGGGTPRGFGPCGTVLDRDVALLFSHPERHFSYLADVTPCIDEGLLLPFYVDGEGVGTIWVIAHDPTVCFDSEDLRVMTSLGAFASTAYQTLLSLDRKLEAGTQRTQCLQETDKLQKALLSSISHDLRSPLASITGALDSVLGDWKLLDVSTQRELLETAQSEARRLNHLVQNLLDMTRLEGAALHLNIEQCDIQDVIGAAIRQLGEVARQRQITVDVAPGLPLVPLDFVLIVQVVTNLLDNALKYSESLAPVQVGAQIGEDQLQVRISDRGKGIREEDIERVFDKFYRETSAGPPGAGLGLSICKGLVETHGGRIWMERRPEGGTVAAFTLPSGGEQ
jgi:signal transduction histidine kinase